MIDKITRVMPESRFEHLKFQVCRVERRLEQVPVYAGKKLVGHKQGIALVPVFRLLGFGSTAPAAERMARRFGL